MHINGATDSIQSIEQSFDTANQSAIWRLSGRVKFFQRFYKRFKLAATNRLSKFEISSENTRSFKRIFQKLQLLYRSHSLHL